MGKNGIRRRTWRELLRLHHPLQLPAAHDALAARLIEQAGFPAYQIGGFAVDGARFGLPDIDLTRFAEKFAAVREIMAISDLPVLVDADDGYGDAKNVSHTIHLYESIGASALFIEDQQPPKRCGHMAGKKVVAAEYMENKIRAAVEARKNRENLFLIARTDAIAPHGLKDALYRAERYLKAGADALYFDGVRNMKELKKVGSQFRGTPLVTTILEGGGETPWVPPKELYEIGFSMILYPTTILFRLTKAIQRALADLKAGRQMPEKDSVSMREFETIVDLPFWAVIETKFQGGGKEEGGSLVRKLIDSIAG